MPYYNNPYPYQTMQNFQQPNYSMGQQNQSYQPSYQSYQQPQQQPPLFQSNNGITWVQGEVGAKAYPVGAGNSVLLMDSDGQYFYIKSADQVGMPMLKKFAYTEIIEEPMLKLESRESAPHQEPIDTAQFATKDDIKSLESKIELLQQEQKMKREQQNNQQSQQNHGR